MSRIGLLGVVVVVIAASFACVAVLRKKPEPDAQLNVSFGPNGVQKILYGSDLLEDLDAYPADAFHIWHVKMTNLKGEIVSAGQYGWGENNSGRQWDPSTQTWTYTFSWGKIETQFRQKGNTLDIHVRETNSADSHMVLDGVTIYPFALHFPKLPQSFQNYSYPQLAFNTLQPSVTTADYDSGEVVSVVPDSAMWLYSGFWPTGSGGAYTPMISSTSPDGLATFQPHRDRPVQPGETDDFTISLRFAPSGTPSASVAKDAYANWAKEAPAQLEWPDRRPIGTVYLASSPVGNTNQAAGYPNNPRRYFNDRSADDFDVTSAAGIKAFQHRILQQAASNVSNMRKMNAQGAITWDLEGQEYPQNTSYVCAPDEIAAVAPEMESVISSTETPYNGMKLDDAYFKVMRDAGFRVGLCVRPQHFILQGKGKARQVYLDAKSQEAELLRKMRYAHDRWGATLFYVDSSVGPEGTVIEAQVFQRLAKALPDCLIIPEEGTPKDYAYAAPLKNFMAHGDLGTDPTVHEYYPKAFSATLINDVDPGTLAGHKQKLAASVAAGDVLLAHVDYWQANNATVVSIYKAASAPQE